ncbi:hypothetical protein ACFX19_010058 [Malus domestica]
MLELLAFFRHERQKMGSGVAAPCSVVLAYQIELSQQIPMANQLQPILSEKREACCIPILHCIGGKSGHGGMSSRLTTVASMGRTDIGRVETNGSNVCYITSSSWPNGSGKNFDVKAWLGRYSG